MITTNENSSRLLSSARGAASSPASAPNPAHKFHRVSSLVLALLGKCYCFSSRNLVKAVVAISPQCLKASSSEPHLVYLSVNFAL